MKSIFKSVDPYGGRVVSANQNEWIGPSTPLDVQGFDYSTDKYDEWHAQARVLFSALLHHPSRAHVRLRTFPAFHQRQAALSVTGASKTLVIYL